jgi:hypothetical protein
MATTCAVKGTLDSFTATNNTSPVLLAYKGCQPGDKGIPVRFFEVDPQSTGNIIFTVDRSSGVSNIQIFQKDAINGSASPAGYRSYFDIEKAGKSKGVVAMTVTNATKIYVVKITFDDYSVASYNGSVVVP